MKYDTKKLSPVQKVAASMESPDHGVYYNPNKCIPDGVSSLEKPTSTLGSFVQYIPVLVFTPVKTSSRLEPRKDAVDKDGMEALIQEFKSVTLGVEQEESKEESKEEEEQGSWDSDDDTRKEKLGRYETLADRHKSEKVHVIRSYRLADEEEEDKKEEEEKE